MSDHKFVFFSCYFQNGIYILSPFPKSQEVLYQFTGAIYFFFETYQDSNIKRSSLQARLTAFSNLIDKSFSQIQQIMLNNLKLDFLL